MPRTGNTSSPGPTDSSTITRQAARDGVAFEADFGWGADKTQNILWRLENGELDGVNPKVVVLLASTNNLAEDPNADDITRGLEAIVHVIQEKASTAIVIVMGIFPQSHDELRTWLYGLSKFRACLRSKLQPVDRKADITYIRLGREFVYLAVVLDAFLRCVVGWSVGRSSQATLPLAALNQAMEDRQRRLEWCIVTSAAPSTPAIEYLKKATSFRKTRPFLENYCCHPPPSALYN